MTQTRYSRLPRFAATLLVSAGLLAAAPASAHEVGTDNGVTVALHVEPDDVPVAGSLTQLELFYSVAAGQPAFKNTKCTCTVMLKANGKLLETAAIIPVANEVAQASVDITFPKLGAYQVIVAGYATDNSFPSFSIPFDVTVNTASSAGLHSTTLLEQVGIGALVIVLVGVTIWYGRPKKRSSPPAAE